MIRNFTVNFSSVELLLVLRSLGALVLRWHDIRVLLVRIIECRWLHGIGVVLNGSGQRRVRRILRVHWNCILRIVWHPSHHHWLSVKHARLLLVTVIFLLLIMNYRFFHWHTRNRIVDIRLVLALGRLILLKLSLIRVALNFLK